MKTELIGKRIRFYRNRKKWNQETFAEKVNLSSAYIGMIERGEKIPKLETFLRIANTLEVSADLLLADVIETGYTIKTSELSERIGKLTPDDRERIFEVVETMLNHKRKM